MEAVLRNLPLYEAQPTTKGISLHAAPLQAGKPPISEFRRPSDGMSKYSVDKPAERRAIDPDALTALEGLLDEAHDAAELVENLAAKRVISWAEARELVEAYSGLAPRWRRRAI